MSVAIDLKNKRFGRLFAIKVVGTSKIGRIWLCQCDCGNRTEAKTPDLKCGKVVSCGCRRRELLSGSVNRGNFKPNAVWKTKEYYRDWKRNKRKNDPLYVLKSRISANLRISFKNLNLDKTNPTFSLLGYSPEELRTHIEKCFLKGMGWHNMGEWHIDHIIPLSSAKTEQDLISLNQIPNLRPMWAMDNIIKGCNRTHLI